MSVRNLDRIFRPERVAVVGASTRPGSVGHTVLRNLITAGFGGVVYPVNPKHEAVHGIQAHPDVGRLPKVPDLAIVAVPAAGVPRVVQECGEAGIPGLIILTAGFRESGEAGLAAEGRIKEVARQFDGMRILGPNCLGAIVPSVGLNASFAAGMPRAGNVAFLSQSGALCTSVLDWALQEEIGFSHFVSIGNALDISIGDLIDYFGEDEQTDSIILYVESITDARHFMSASRAFARTKPIVAYKAGRFAESAQAAASHTGAMAGEDAIYDAAFERAGIVRVYEIDDMFECAELLARRKAPTGPRLAVITNAGGPGVMATDTLMARHGVLAELSAATIERLDGVLPAFWSRGNPVDLLGDATPQRYAQATEIVLADPGVDAAIVVLAPQAMTDPTETAAAVATVLEATTKPVLAAWMGGRSVEGGIRLLNRARVPTYASPERAVNAFMFLVSYARNVETLYETPRDIPVSFALDRRKLRDVFSTILLSRDDVLSETFSKALLEAYEIPTTTPVPARTADEAVQAARRVGHPVVLKIMSPDITHKTDVGGVAVSLRDDDEVRRAYERIVSDAARHRPDAAIEGVTVQPMVDTAHGVELILGAKKDPVFGSIIMVGSGGVAAEIYGDRVLGLPPLNERLARRMVESCKCYPVLTGFRGRPATNIDRLIEILMRLSYLVADYPEIAELDINPLLVTPQDVIALDARVVLDRDVDHDRVKPCSHLAIPPYPEHYVRHTRTRDGAALVLRPIKPEDEPMWHALLAACSAESIRGRFRQLIQGTTHAMATRYCFNDYDREMGIVAEIGEGEQRRLIAVGRLVADPDHDSAEYAILVGDAWQGQGVGRQITEHCLRIAEDWHLRRVTASTSASNPRMVKIFDQLGFTLEANLMEGLVEARKELGEEGRKGGREEGREDVDAERASAAPRR